MLARTSNPEGSLLQQATTTAGRSVAEDVVAQASVCNAGASPLGSVGLVVGATIEDRLDLDGLNGPVLMPGVGAQGGTAADVRRVMDGHSRWVVPSVSREVLAAGPEVAALRAAVAAQAERLADLR